ncbi:MAG: hypothetical protein RBU21_00135 [FCB group bacterium]|jgi:hypothetical protein|nr:hypothetical protein [FCB group bacterium]
MKHVKVLSNTKPACAEYTSFLEFKNIFRGLGLTPERQNWLADELNDLLQK